jgi:hypothetical protein
MPEQYQEINAWLEKQCEQKPAWSEEDENVISESEVWLDTLCDYLKDSSSAYIPNVRDIISKLKSFKDRVLPQPKQEWSEEDERMYRGLHNLIYSTSYCDSRKEFSDFLNSLKDRVQPQNWTKEDKERYISCLQRLSTGNPEQPETINSKWFKEHVYSQATWKPSDEQMDAVKDAIDYLGGNTKIVRKYLMSLYEDLKKLREK